MSSPRRYILRMFIFLAVIGAGAVALREPLTFAFMSNLAINGVILTALVIGILFSFRQTLRLLPEHRWMVQAARTPDKVESIPMPSLLGTVAVLLVDNPSGVSPQGLRSVLDGIAIRLDESREISRYMIGLLIFLGLLGTFWGLLGTVQAVGGVVGAIDTSSSGFENMVAQLKNGLEGPLAGMATAFSSSLFGLGGSLVLGFLDLQLGQASGRFYTDVEDWLSRSTRHTGGRGGASPELVGGLTEAAADKLHDLARAIEAGEATKGDLAASLRELTASLAALGDSRQQSAALSESLAELGIALTNLGREMRDDRKEINTTISMELRALSKALTKSQGARAATRATKGKG